MATPLARDAPEALIRCLVLWNIDLTLVDVSRVTRAAYADAFQQVTGRRLIQLPQFAGQSESEIFFDALARNDADHTDGGDGGDALLAAFYDALAGAFAARQGDLTGQGRLLSGAAQAVETLASRPDVVVQSVLTGTIRPNAVAKLAAFGLEGYFDFEVGGYGSESYPKGALVMMARGRAAEKYGKTFTELNTVYVGDSVRDVAAAKRGGARSVAVATGRSTESDLRAAGADLVLPDLADVPAVLRGIGLLTMPSAS
ncbi:MAG TPA: HAD hydrolase-like protein [Streptosporangiaceae bacterium]|nr:HAD hydrolase-like protein [Streptosporangiaceae bacterium]